jgi:predicted transcriptional regulator
MGQPKGHRSSVEIVADILRLLRLGHTGKTEIAYMSQISREQATKYLTKLIEAGVLEESGEEMRLPSYRITQKGLSLLSMIENTKEMLPPDGTVNILHHSKILEINLGDILVTRGVAELARERKQFDTFVQKSLGRHRKGDWGEMNDEDKRLNDESQEKGRRLFSSYESKGFPEIWIITEPNRSYTTIMFPDEFASMVPLERNWLAAHLKTPEENEA